MSEASHACTLCFNMLLLASLHKSDMSGPTLISLSSFLREGWALNRAIFSLPMGDDTPAADFDYDTDSVSTADTHQSGISIIDELWCALPPPVLCNVLTCLQPATAAAFAASSLEYFEHFQTTVLWFVLQLVSSFFSLIRGHE